MDSINSGADRAPPFARFILFDDFVEEASDGGQKDVSTDSARSEQTETALGRLSGALGNGLPVGDGSWCVHKPSYTD